MKANELRIRNAVYYKSDVYYINIISHTVEIDQGEESTIVDYCDIEPIPLTEECFLKFGFYRYADGWALDSGMLGLFYNLETDMVEISIEGQYLPLPHIKYIHQIQNLWFNLTGKEL